MSKMLVDVHKYHGLDRLLADVLIINHAKTREQAKRYLLRAIETAEELKKI